MTHALITGASSGIGYEFSHIAASKGYNLILIARNAEKLMQMRTELEELYSIKVLAVGCDLATADAPDKIAGLLQNRNIIPDLLINNAGFGQFGPFEQTDVDDEIDMMQVNMITLTELTKYIYKHMLHRGSGRILNVASLAGCMPGGPLMAVYYATKAYVLSFSQALANEAKGRGVSVTVLCPGPTASNFESRASLKKSVMFSSFGKIPSSKQVAEYGWKHMMKGKTIAIHGKLNRLMAFLVRWLPRNTVVNMVRYKQRPVESIQKES